MDVLKLISTELSLFKATEQEIEYHHNSPDDFKDDDKELGPMEERVLTLQMVAHRYREMFEEEKFKARTKITVTDEEKEEMQRLANFADLVLKVFWYEARNLYNAWDCNVGVRKKNGRLFLVKYEETPGERMMRMLGGG